MADRRTSGLLWPVGEPGRCKALRATAAGEPAVPDVTAAPPAGEPRHAKSRPERARPAPQRESRASAHLLARGHQVLRRLHDACGHAGFGRLEVGPRVVDLLVADLAVDLQHAVVVLEEDRKSTRLNSSHVKIS